MTSSFYINQKEFKMKIFKFKTNIEGDGGIREVSPLLNEEKSISQWNIDQERRDHLLSVSGEELNPQIVKDLVGKAGYEAELVRVLAIGGEDV